MLEKYPLSQENIEEIINLYLVEKKSFSSIGKIYHKGYLVIKKILLNNNVRLRTYEEDVALRVSRYNKTCINKYGVSNVSQVPEIKIKKEKTSVEHFGVSNYNKLEESKERHKQVYIEKYGVDNPSKSEIIKQKKINKVKAIDPSCVNVFQLESVKNQIKETLLEKYEVDNPMKIKEIREKVQATNLLQYGNACPLLGEKVKEKTKKTLIERYGVASYSQTKEFHSKSARKYYCDDQTFDSMPELAVWIYAKDHDIAIERVPMKIEYTFKGKTHYYFPDFMYNGKLIEIKSDYLYRQMLNKNTIGNAKLKCMRVNNVEIWTFRKYRFAINYCINKYGRKFKERFRSK